MMVSSGASVIAYRTMVVQPCADWTYQPAARRHLVEGTGNQ
jgi:hypothetical protein